MELCILIPAKNEEASILGTIDELYSSLEDKVMVNYLVIDDYSNDNTISVLEELKIKYTNFSFLKNSESPGVGGAISFGLKNWQGDVLAICMADGSDSAENILYSFIEIEQNNYDCVFGSRFIKGGEVINYPKNKLFYNRIFNTLVKLYSGYPYNDYTNIFKVYSRFSIDTIGDLESQNFSIGLEMSLKAYNRNLNIKVIPISWRQRKFGKSKLRLIKNFKSYMHILLKNS